MDDLIRLDDVAEELLGMTPDRARRRFGAGTLPIPAFRTGCAKRGPIYIHREDMERHIEQRRKAATTLVNKMRHAGVTTE